MCCGVKRYEELGARYGVSVIAVIAGLPRNPLALKDYDNESDYDLSRTTHKILRNISV
jgi:hypothetical protein